MSQHKTSHKKPKFVSKLLVTITIDSKEIPSTVKELTKKDLASLIEQGREIRIVDALTGQVKNMSGQYIGGNWLQEKVRCPKCGSERTSCYLGFNDVSDISLGLSGGEIGFVLGCFLVECLACDKYYMFNCSDELHLDYIEEGPLKCGEGGAA